MDPRRSAPLVGWVLAAGLAALASCTVSTEDNFTNPPPGPPASCVTATAIDGCSGGSVSYSCTGGRPDEGDTNLVCSVGTPSVAGATLYCCAPYGQFYSECTVTTTIPGCVGNSLGFACSGATSPDQADSSLTCSKGAVSGAQKTFCCTSGPIASTCAPDPMVSDCTGVAIGYSCAGPDAPAGANASVTCGPATPPGPGETSHCCIPFAKSMAACDEDDAVPGCDAAGSFGFSCAGAASPDETNPALHCSAGAPAAGGGATFCCQLRP
jgi:hypothetical protein